jgi:queuine tRNA-ribosyltransferase
MAAIHAMESIPKQDRRGRLLLVSFENDLDSFTLALRHRSWFKHLKHAAPERLLTEQRWESACGTIEWRLLHGDFVERKFDAPTPQVIFFDPFSFKTDSELWTLPAFRELARVCGDSSTEIFTYTYSTAVRAAMLAAGFYVAKGRATGPKIETTIGMSRAAVDAQHERELLGAEWLTRWHRSEAQAPFGVSADDQTWRDAVLNHPQFSAQRK